MAHDLETAKQADSGALCHRRDQLLHLRISRPREHARGVLQVHQHDIAAALFELRDAPLDQLPVDAQIIAAQHRIGADLPDHQFGTLGDHVVIQPGQLFGDVFAAFAAIDHPDVETGEPVSERGLEPARIGQPRSARSGPLGRG